MWKRWLSMFALAVWFGGFTFYSAIVVPIGDSVLDSDLLQGLITRRVTLWLNGAGVITLVLWAGVVWEEGRLAPRKMRRTAWTMLGLLVVTQLTLLFLHPQLEARIVFDPPSIRERGTFRSLHAIYLQVSTLQWLFIAIFLGVLLRIWRAADARAAEEAAR
ncbi:MAG: hypothetical protein RL885_28400 [Planctomycetota bacterium]